MPGKTREKRSFALSHSSVMFLERLRRERRAPSTSRVLDELIRQEASRHRRTRVEEAIGAYYSELSEAEISEQKAWGLRFHSR